MIGYPRFLKLDDDVEARLKSFIYDEMVRHLHERTQLLDELKMWQTEYWAKPPTEQATFPFKGASRVIIPLEAIAVEAVHARNITTLFGTTPFVSCRTRNADFESTAPLLENWITFEMIRNIKCFNPVNDLVLEIEKFGTGIGKSGYEKIMKKSVRDLPDGTSEEIMILQKNGATLDATPLANFLMPFAYLDPQTAPWCGETHTKTPFEIKTFEESGMFVKGTFDRLKNWVQQTNVIGQYKEREYMRHMEELEKRKSFWPRVIDFYELWMSFDVDGDGLNEEIQVFFHMPTQFIMGIRYNWYEDLHRPYRVGNYMRVENRWRGIGICKQTEQFQRAVTAIHRQRLDNATLANMRMFKIHKLSGYGPNEPLFPGKMWFLDDMSHIETVQMGDVYQSAFADEQSLMIYAQQRNSATEVMLGMPQAGTPGTATSDLSRIQEGNKKIDYYLMNIKRALNDLTTDVLVNIHQFGSRTIDYFTYATDSQKLQQLFSLPVNVIRDGLLFDVEWAGQQRNRIVDRQSWLQNAQLLAQYYESMVQLAQLSGDRNLMGAIIRKALVAATEAIKQILESSDISNVDRMILSDLLKDGGVSLVPGVNPAVSVGGGNNGNPGNVQNAGMAPIQAILASFGKALPPGTGGIQ